MNAGLGFYLTLLAVKGWCTKPGLIPVFDPVTHRIIELRPKPKLFVEYLPVHLHEDGTSSRWSTPKEMEDGRWSILVNPYWGIREGDTILLPVYGTVRGKVVHMDRRTVVEFISTDLIEGGRRKVTLRPDKPLNGFRPEVTRELARATGKKLEAPCPPEPKPKKVAKHH